MGFDIKESKELADKVLNLIDTMEKTFPNSPLKEKTRLAIMAGLVDAYNRGRFDTLDSRNPNIQVVNHPYNK